jgi:hypothetical protein
MTQRSQTETTPKLIKIIYRDGTRFLFERKAKSNRDGLFSLHQLADDEIMIAPDFIYRWIP